MSELTQVDVSWNEWVTPFDVAAQAFIPAVSSETAVDAGGLVIAAMFGQSSRALSMSLSNSLVSTL